MVNELPRLWLSHHANHFHYSELGYNRLCKSELFVTKSFKKYQLPFRIDWSVDPFSSKSWRLYFHSLDWLHSFRFAINNLNRSEELEVALGIIFDWWRNNSNQENIDAMAWDDHATANRLANLCFWYRLTNDLEKKAKLVEIIDFHCIKIQEFYESGHWTSNNHGIFHIASLINVINIFKNQKMSVNCKILAQNYLDILVKSIIHKDSGYSVEQSTFYHQFVIREFKPLLDVIGENDVIDSHGIESCVNKMIYFLNMISTDSGNVSSLGDTAYGFKVDSKYKNISKDDYYSLCYEDTGISIVGGNSPKGQNISTFSFHKDRTSHGHFSPLNFTLILDDNKILVDSGGSYAYGEKFRFDYIISNFAHNCITVDGNNSKDGCEYIDSKSGPISFVSASSKSENSEITRTVVSLNGQLFIIFDKILSKNKSNIDTFWHFPPNIKSISHDDVLLDNRIEFQSSKKSKFLNYVLEIEDCKYLLSVSSSNLYSKSLYYGFSGKQPQGWVTTRHRTIEPAHCLIISGEKLKNMHNSTIVFNQESDYEILSQSYNEVLLSSDEFGMVRIRMSDNVPIVDYIQ